VGDGEKLLTHLNSALKVLLGLYIFPHVPKKKLNFVDQCNFGFIFSSRSCTWLQCSLSIFSNTKIVTEMSDHKILKNHSGKALRR